MRVSQASSSFTEHCRLLTFERTSDFSFQAEQFDMHRDSFTAGIIYLSSAKVLRFGRERRYLRGVNASSEECSRLIQTKREAPLKLDPDNAPAIPSVTAPRSSPSRRNRCKKKFEEKTEKKLSWWATHSSQTCIHRK